MEHRSAPNGSEHESRHDPDALRLSIPVDAILFGGCDWFNRRIGQLLRPIRLDCYRLKCAASLRGAVARR
jgi:hypothetical protein